jgi:hypothetical protein
MQEIDELAPRSLITWPSGKVRKPNITLQNSSPTSEVVWIEEYVLKCIGVYFALWWGFLLFFF